MHLVVFEASKWDTFAPLTLSRPAFALLCGVNTLLDKQIRYIKPDRLTLWMRPELADFCQKNIVTKLKVPTKINEPLDDEAALILSGRSLHFSKFEVPSDPCVSLEQGGLLLKAFVKKPGLNITDALNRTKAWLDLANLPQTMAQSRLPEFLWDLINWNEEAIVADSIHLQDGYDGKPAGPYHLVNDDNVFINKEVKLAPGVVLDASRGPVILDRGAVIGANSVLEGPCYIGMYSRIAPLTNIRAGTTLGPGCNVGGVVANSIIMGFADKPHEGYLGDSYVGRWTNLGAGTTTANVKTTYGQISVSIAHRKIETGRRSMGAIIGDHTKTSINTRFSPGCYVGYNCILAGAGLVPQFVPSFSFWNDQGIKPVDRAKSIEMAKRVYDRRDRQWTGVEDAVHKYAAQAAPGVEK
jgi:UDP-N-acetylglucosamine diphosphorylase/glucosamine-1-phosphate N-acetyltransferase